MKNKTIGIRILMFFSIVGLSMIFAVPAMARTIRVNSTLDVIANDGLCTLREAVIAANTDTASGSLDGECPAGKGVDTIKLKSGEYKFTIGGTGEDNAQTGDLDILDDLTIEGKGAEKTFINANYIDRVFHVMNSVKANFIGITIQNGAPGDGNGGGIENAGTITITNSTVSDNAATGSTFGVGGGIYCDGTIKITNSIITSNAAFGLTTGAYGGGISNLGLMKMTNSTVSSNSAVSTDFYALGGGIYNNDKGTMKMTNIKVSYNTALSTNSSTYGGGISNDGTITMTNITVSANTASSTNSSAYGGGIYNFMDGEITVKGISRISKNDAGDGGGVYNFGTFNASKNTRIKNNTPDDYVEG
jgi:CSLREA domain-containing protein